MAHPRPFRFGVQLSRADTGAEWAALARKAEGLGYSTLFVPDHFGDQLSPAVALMSAADATTDLRVGPLVLDNDFRHPVVLAKEAASIDRLSGGRLELGIGAGWMNDDYDHSGIAMDLPGVRIDRLEEALDVLEGLFAPGPFSYEGKHYRISALDGLPKPVQPDGPPVVIGAGGRRLLSLAARRADVVGVNPSVRSGRTDAAAAQDGAADVTDRKLEWVRDAAGSRYGDIEINMLIFACVVTDDRASVIDAMAPLFGVPPEIVGDHPHAWVGTVAQICDDLVARRERWDASYLVVQGPEAMDAAAPIVARLAGT
ncbi:MAG TPA: TIGR03621 family F420-dependent LLM class oxidoreductase [Acidimicrobiales bacterium]|jgi:probable F420-dependent oxidoreductase|nr:TIGR03621 family F420-dependent LLM class oxidoreductase [Acidimicrobiales bacterium]